MTNVMEYFKSLTTTALAELINSTRKELYLCMPALHPEVADAIAELDYMQNHEKENVRIKLLVDFDAQTFRQGYGNFQSVENLFNGEFEIKNLKDNRISFIISDNIGYYLFIESRSLIPADKETINAVKIDSVSRVRLKNYFFPNEEKKDFQNELADAIIEESKTLDNPEELIPDKPAPVLDLSIEMVEDVKNDLEKNPPLNPDYKRIVEFYSNKFQYVKFKFEGANLQSRKIEIPSQALPVMDATLKNKLETKLNLFEKNDEQKYFKPLNDFKEKVADISSHFSIPELIAVKETYGISIQAIMPRAKDLGVINQSQFIAFRKWISRNRTEEGLGNYQGSEQPFRFKQLIYRAAAEEIISLSKAANLSNQKLAQFRKEFVAL